MSTKRIELTDLDVVEIVSALRAQGDTYVKLSGARLDMGWTDTAVYYRKCAERCFATIVKLEESDTVAIETDEMDEPLGQSVNSAVNRYMEARVEISSPGS